MSPGLHEATLSIRMLWPFARLLGLDDRLHELIPSTGLTMSQFGNPDTRVSHRAAMAALARSVEILADPLLGLRAGHIGEQGDFDILEYAARSAANFGDAMTVMARYLRIMHEAAQVSLDVEGDFAFWRFRVNDDVPQPPAADDFVLMSALAFSRRNVAVAEAPVAVHFMHEEPAYAAAYPTYFETHEFRYGAPDNVIVMRKARLAAPMARTNPEMSQAFELQARRTLEKLQGREGLSGRVREEIASQFRTGSVSMAQTAKHLAMGVATLRRRLEDEGTTFRDIVDGLRRELAERHLVGAGPTVSEVAFLLGFSDVRAFGRAFRRWTGRSPTEYRSSHSPSHSH
jgi:AraC-like DNA-binding protein